MKCPNCGYDLAANKPAPLPDRPPPRLDRLTPRQCDVLRFIETCIHNEGFPPTLREIGSALGVLSTNGVNDKIQALVSKGYIERDPMISRGIRVLYGTDIAEKVGLKALAVKEGA